MSNRRPASAGATRRELRPISANAQPQAVGSSSASTKKGALPLAPTTLSKKKEPSTTGGLAALLSLHKASTANFDRQLLHSGHKQSGTVSVKSETMRTSDSSRPRRSPRGPSDSNEASSSPLSSSSRSAIVPEEHSGDRRSGRSVIPSSSSLSTAVVRMKPTRPSSASTQRSSSTPAAPVADVPVMAKSQTQPLSTEPPTSSHQPSSRMLRFREMINGNNNNTTTPSLNRVEKREEPSAAQIATEEEDHNGRFHSDDDNGEEEDQLVPCQRASKVGSMHSGDAAQSEEESGGGLLLSHALSGSSSLSGSTSLVRLNHHQQLVVSSSTAVTSEKPFRSSTTASGAGGLGSLVFKDPSWAERNPTPTGHNNNPSVPLPLTSLEPRNTGRYVRESSVPTLNHKDFGLFSCARCGLPAFPRHSKTAEGVVMGYAAFSSLFERCVIMELTVSACCGSSAGDVFASDASNAVATVILRCSRCKLMLGDVWKTKTMMGRGGGSGSSLSPSPGQVARVLSDAVWYAGVPIPEALRYPNGGGLREQSVADEQHGAAYALSDDGDDGDDDDETPSEGSDWLENDDAFRL